MAINEWRGDSQPVAQVVACEVTDEGDDGDEFRLTVNGKRATYVKVTGDTVKSAAAGFAAAINAARETVTEFSEFTVDYVEGEATFRLIAATAGMPFVTQGSTTGTAALSHGTTVASMGPNHINDPKNWTLGAVPTNDTDTLIVNGGASLLYGFDALGLRGLSFEVRAGFQNSIGLPKWNAAGYYEYRTRQLELRPATVIIRGGSQMRFLAKDSQVWRIEATGNAEDNNTPAVCIEFTAAPESIRVAGSSNVGLQWESEATATTLPLVYQSGAASSVRLGRNLTVTAFDKDAGELESFATLTTLTNSAGQATLNEGTLGTLNAYSGLINLNIAGTIANVNATATGPDTAPIVNCENNDRARTFTASTFRGGACLYDSNRTVTTGGGTHTADALFFQNSRLGPVMGWVRT